MKFNMLTIGKNLLGTDVRLRNEEADSLHNKNSLIGKVKINSLRHF